MKYFHHLIIFINIVTGAIFAHDKQDILISSQTKNVNKRYYFVARLEKTIQLLNTIKQQNSRFSVMKKKINFNDLVKFDDAPHFKHSRIQESIMLMQKNKNLKPLYTVWDDFSAYKFLEDELFIDEFTKEIFVISRNLLLQMLPEKTIRTYNSSINDIFNNAINSSTKNIIDYIDVFTQAATDAQNNKSYNISKLHETYRLTDLEKEIHTDQISERFYLLKRMMKALNALKNIKNYKNTAFKFPINKENPFVIFDDSIEFTHDRIIHCIEAMESQESIEPLFTLWDDYRQFRYIENEHFTREFFIVVFITYKNFIINNTSQETTRSNSISDAVELYQKINSLSTDEIVESIDTLVEITELIGLREKITWRQWSRDYWWVGPTILSSAAYSYFMHKK